jgi:hypothetical protein
MLKGVTPDHVSSILSCQKFPKDLINVIVPVGWKPDHWTVFQWFSGPCVYLYGREPHPHFNIETGNGPTETEPDFAEEGEQPVKREEDTI